MTRLVFALLLSSIHAAGQACHLEDPVADEKALRDASTCQSAYKQYYDCRWGSSADGWRGAIVRQRCEPLFLPKLTAKEKSVYEDKLNFCGQQYELATGTLATSERNTCALRVVVDFATDSKLASKSLPFASFDCSLARTPIEKSVCSNPRLGRADLLVSTAYKPLFNAVHGDARAQLIGNQRAWNASTPLACHLTSTPTTQTVVSCLVETYKERADLLRECSNGLEVGDCLHSDAAPRTLIKANGRPTIEQ